MSPRQFYNIRIKNISWRIDQFLFIFIFMSRFIEKIYTNKPRTYSGVQRINNVFHIVDEVENVCVNKYIFDLIDNVEYDVYALYSSIGPYYIN